MKIICTMQEFASLRRDDDVVAESTRAEANRQAYLLEKQVSDRLVSESNRLLSENWGTHERIHDLENQLKEKETQVSNLMKKIPDSHLQTDAQFLSVEHRKLVDEILVHVHQGNKINACKAYRELTGLGLKEAKNAIEGGLG